MVISLKEKQLHAFCFYARLTLLLAVFLLQEDLRLAYLLIWGFVGFSFKSTFERFLSDISYCRIPLSLGDLRMHPLSPFHSEEKPIFN